MPSLRVKKLNDEAIIPYPATEGSAAIDLTTITTKTIRPGEIILFKTGLQIAIPSSHAGILCSRSGLGTKRGLVIAQGVGIIDCDYRGEIMVPIYCRRLKGKNIPQKICKGDRIAQLMIVELPTIFVEEVDTLDDTDRGEGGLGSTGT